MAAGKGENWLVWGVLGLMVVAGLAALALAPGAPGGPGPPGGNRPPAAVVSPTNVSVNLGDTVTFDGANSTDPDGTVRAFAWSFGDGNSGAGAVVSHKYEITGAFQVRLEVTDDRGAKNTSTTSVWVNLNQAIPFGTATWNQIAGSVPSSLAFPVDPNATHIAVSLEVNTSTFVGARAVVSLLDPNGAVVHAANATLTFGQVATAISFVVDQPNITVEGQWSLRVEAQPLNPAQPSATVGYSGSVRVEYRP